MDKKTELTGVTPNTLTNKGTEDLFTPVQGSERDLKGTHLGQLPLTSAGFSQGFKDSDTVQVPGAGILFTVEQASYGRTGIAASAEEGYKIEALRINPDTKAPEWIKPNPVLGKTVDVATDRGNLSKIPDDSPSWSKFNMGNPGVKSGAVKVTNQATGEVKYYALGAQFTGKQDGWQVRRGVIELTPTPALSKAKEALAPQSPSEAK